MDEHQQDDGERQQDVEERYLPAVAL